LAVVALGESDPQRVAALKHADECPACAVLLEQSAELLAVIDDSEPALLVRRELKQRVERAVWGDRSQPSLVLRWLLSALGMISLGLVLLDGHLDQPLSAELGIRCLAFETGIGLAPVPLAALLARTGAVRASALHLVGWTTGFAVIGQLLLRTRCVAHGAGLHLLAFHVTGIVLAALLGVAAEALIRKRLVR